MSESNNTAAENPVPIQPETSERDQDIAPLQAQFLVGSCIGRAFSVFVRNFAPFTLLAILVYMPPLFYELFLAKELASSSPSWRKILDILFPIIEFLLVYLLTAVIIYCTIQELRGRHTGIGECVRRGFPLMFPVMGVAIVLIIVVTVGAMALIIPGLILFTMYWLAIPVAVIERPGVFASLKRSAQLSKGFRWKIFGLFLMIIAVSYGVNFMVALLTGVSWLALATYQAPYGVVIVFFLFSSVFGAYYAVVNAVAYHDIRMAKEGVGIEEIAAVFD